MKAIATMFPNPEKPKRQLLGKQYKVGDTIRIHRDPPLKAKFINKWRNPYEEKGEVTAVDGRDHYWIKSHKSGRVTREHASRLAKCLYASTC